MKKLVKRTIGGKTLSIESGEIAKQANGAVLVRYEDTVVLVSSVAAAKPREDVDFFPLMVDYREKTYAAGKIPGGFFKREGRPGEKETLTSRLIDRPLRPLFPDGFCNDTQIICFTVSADQQNDPDILAIIGASASLEVSDIPFMGPIGAVRVGRVDGAFIANPTYEELEKSDLNLIVAGTQDAIAMVEGGAAELPESVMVDALEFAQNIIKDVVSMQLELREGFGKDKMVIPEVEKNTEIFDKVAGVAGGKVRDAFQIAEKQNRDDKFKNIRGELISQLNSDEDDELTKNIKIAFDDLKKSTIRKMISDDNIRADGRGLKDVRPITSRVGLLPRTHGSALFTRGETQALVVSTLGTGSDEQRLDKLEGKTTKRFMLHYNFPPFCVGETKFNLSPSRREIGHGALAERAMSYIMPDSEEFPYTIRIVSDIMESNGSSSMASVCGASLSLMDAGVPIAAPVAGIAMGLIKEGDKYSILSDILGLEDHIGDMDFKVAGTRNGITALQMDIKIGGVDGKLMETALDQAKEGRMHILGKMEEAIANPRDNLSAYAPRIFTLKVKPEKVGGIIGPGGKVIRGIIEKTGVTIDIEDDGRVIIASPDEECANKAIKIIEDIIQEAEVGKIYSGTVSKIMDFGAFIELFPGTDGLCHISQLAPYRVKQVTDVLKEGEEVMVKVLEIDHQGKIRLSRLEALSEEERKKKKPD